MEGQIQDQMKGSIDAWNGSSVRGSTGSNFKLRVVPG